MGNPNKPLPTHTRNSVSMSLLDEQFGVDKNRQDVHLIQLWQMSKDGFTKQIDHVRLRIRSNSYDFQSYAIAEAWRSNGWTECFHILYPLMATPAKLAYSREAPTDVRKRFETDLDRLRTGAAMVLFH